MVSSSSFLNMAPESSWFQELPFKHAPPKKPHGSQQFPFRCSQRWHVAFFPTEFLLVRWFLRWTHRELPAWRSPEAHPQRARGTRTFRVAGSLVLAISPRPKKHQKVSAQDPPMEVANEKYPKRSRFRPCFSFWCVCVCGWGN